MKNKPPYDYEPLYELLQDFDPAELGDHLDEIMSDLVSFAGLDDTYQGETLEHRFSVLRTLRDIFWKMKRSSGDGDQRN